MNTVINPSSSVRLVDIRVSSIKIWLDSEGIFINQAVRSHQSSQILTVAEPGTRWRRLAISRMQKVGIVIVITSEGLRRRLRYLDILSELLVHKKVGVFG
jgi:hypothetical protein